MTNSPEYIIGGTKVEVGQVWECRDGTRVVIDRFNHSNIYPIRASNHCFTSTGRYKTLSDSDFDLIKCVGRVVPLEEVKEPQPAHSEPEQPEFMKNAWRGGYIEPKSIAITEQPRKLKLSAGEMAMFVATVDAHRGEYNAKENASGSAELLAAIENNPELVEYLA